MPIYALHSAPVFPDPNDAEPDGLLALGGDLNPARVLRAYTRGIFPWPIPGAPLAWFSPDPRMLLHFPNLRVSRSLRKRLRDGDYRVTIDTAFDGVIDACSTMPRAGQQGTWITSDMVAAYRRLHTMGYAHSVECWQGDTLVGGLYGVSVGGMFCGESMFHTATDASKVAFVSLARQLQAWGFHFLDCQLHTPHLESLGAATVPRTEFLEQLAEAQTVETKRGPWKFDPPTE